MKNSSGTAHRAMGTGLAALLRVPLALAIVAVTITLSVSNAETLVIDRVTLIDGTGRAPAADMSVLVIDGRVAEIRQGSIAAPTGSVSIDGRGKFLVPGLIDTHIHLPGGVRGALGAKRELIMDQELGRRVLHGYLYSGVTSVYDAGNNPAYIFHMRAEERSGRMVSPRIFAAGSAIAPAQGYLADGGAIEISSYQQGVKELDKLLERKPDILKFSRDSRGVALTPRNMPLIPVDVTRRLIDYSRKQGFRTTGHAVEEALARELVDAGIDTLAHPLFHSVASDELVDSIVNKKVAVSTTLAVIKNISRVVQDPSFFDEPLFQATLSSEEMQFHRVDERSRYLNSKMYQWTDATWPNIAGTVAKLHRAGAILALGTDRAMGAMVQQELEYLVQIGIPPLEAIRIGTLNAAIFLGMERELGSIEQRKLADMVLLSADPLADIRNMRSIAAVFKGGRRIDRAALDLPANRPRRP